MKLSSIITAATVGVTGLSGLASAASPSSLNDTTDRSLILFDLDTPEHNTSNVGRQESGPVHAKLYACGDNNINNNKVQIQDLIFDPYPPFLGKDILIQYDVVLKMKLFASAHTMVRVIGDGRVIGYDWVNFCDAVVNPNPMMPCPVRPGNYTIKHTHLLPDYAISYDYTMQFITCESRTEYEWCHDLIACTEIRGRLAHSGGS